MPCVCVLCVGRCTPCLCKCVCVCVATGGVYAVCVCGVCGGSVCGV